jgi:hypothetical protein
MWDESAGHSAQASGTGSSLLRRSQAWRLRRGIRHTHTRTVTAPMGCRGTAHPTLHTRHVARTRTDIPQNVGALAPSHIERAPECLAHTGCTSSVSGEKQQAVSGPRRQGRGCKSRPSLRSCATPHHETLRPPATSCCRGAACCAASSRVVSRTVTRARLGARDRDRFACQALLVTTDEANLVLIRQLL